MSNKPNRKSHVEQNGSDESDIQSTRKDTSQSVSGDVAADTGTASGWPPSDTPPKPGELTIGSKRIRDGQVVQVVDLTAYLAKVVPTTGVIREPMMVPLHQAERWAPYRTVDLRNSLCDPKWVGETLLTDLTPQVLDEAMERLFHVQAFNDRRAEYPDESEAEAAENSLRTAMRRVKCYRADSGRRGKKKNVAAPPEPSTVVAWAHLYAIGGPHAIIPKHHDKGRRGCRQPEIVQTAADEAMRETYLSEKRGTSKQTWDCMIGKLNDVGFIRNNSNGHLCRADGTQVPDDYLRRWLERRIERWCEENPYEATFHREGKGVADSEYHASGRTELPERACAVVEIDEMKADLVTKMMKILHRAGYVVKDGDGKLLRPWLGVARDRYSSAPLALVPYSKAPDANLAVETLRMAVDDKSWIAERLGMSLPMPAPTRPEVLVVDNAKTYANHRFHSAAFMMGTRVLHPRAGDPRARASVERLGADLVSSFYPFLTGQVGNSVADRRTRDPDVPIALTFSEFRDLVQRWWIIHLHTPSEGLGGRTPYAVYSDSLSRWGVNSVPSGDAAVRIFGRRHLRRVGTYGVRCNGIRYQAEVLQEHRRRSNAKVVVCENPYDVGEIHVRIDDIWYAVPSMVPEFRGVRLDEWDSFFRPHEERLRKGAGLNALQRAHELERIRKTDDRIASASPAHARIHTDMAVTKDELDMMGRFHDELARDDGRDQDEDAYHATDVARFEEEASYEADGSGPWRILD